jgi:hypothetical protein
MHRAVYSLAGQPYALREPQAWHGGVRHDLDAHQGPDAADETWLLQLFARVQAHILLSLTVAPCLIAGFLSLCVSHSLTLCERLLYLAPDFLCFVHIPSSRAYALLQRDTFVSTGLCYPARC